MKRTTALVVSLTVLALMSTAAKFWEKNEYTKWSKKDCIKLLSKSPWAFSNSFGNVANIGMIDVGSAGQRETNISFYFRLISAKPVKLALGQLQLLNDPGNAALQQQVQQMANSVDKNILLQIDYSVDPPSDQNGYSRLNTTFLQSSIADFRDNTSLSSSEHVRVWASEYLAPNGKRTNPIFVFPRADENGKPYFDGSEKWISFKSDIAGHSIYYRLKPKDMTFDGKFAM